MYKCAFRGDVNVIKSPFEADTGVRFGLKLPFEGFEVGGGRI